MAYDKYELAQELWKKKTQIFQGHWMIPECSALQTPFLYFWKSWFHGHDLLIREKSSWSTWWHFQTHLHYLSFTPKCNGYHQWQWALVSCSAHGREFAEWSIGFNGISTCLGIFYALRFGNSIYCTFIFTFIVLRILYSQEYLISDIWKNNLHKVL